MPREAMAPGTGQHVARVVLLGASNLTRALPRAVAHAHRLLGGPLEVLVAAGHGRSYGMRSRVLVRDLPGILECGLWKALRPAAVPTVALITDIGNDIVYGADPSTIEGWIDGCLDRLARHRAQTVLTRLPIEPVRALHPAHYRVVSRLLFPRHQLSYRAALDGAAELDDRIRALAAHRGVPAVPMRHTWYGLDPIHLRRASWPEAWQTILAPWRDAGETPPALAPPLRWWLTLRAATPERWWLLGRPRGRRQPAARLPGGTTVAFY